MRTHEMHQAIGNARSTLRAADSVASDLAPLLKGRLRHCYASDLEALKKELKDFNMHTGMWRDLGERK